MARKFKQKGDVLTYTNAGSAIAAGAVVAMADLVGIAEVDIAATTGVGTVAIEGVHLVPKIAGTAWVLGDSVDWDASAVAFGKGITPAAGDVLLAAVAFQAAASGDTTAYVKLTPGAGTGQ